MSTIPFCALVSFLHILLFHVQPSIAFVVQRSLLHQNAQAPESLQSLHNSNNDKRYPLYISTRIMSTSSSTGIPPLSSPPRAADSPTNNGNDTTHNDTPIITTKANSKTLGKAGRKVTLRRYLNALVRKNPEVSRLYS
jgi:hypothetical protein